MRIRNKAKTKAYDAMYHETHREIRNSRARAWNAAHREHCRQRAKDYLRKYKLMVFGHYGSKCVCCGVTEETFLTIDHINNNGKEHRDSIGAGYTWYKHIIAMGFPKDLQILCMNCNYGKRRRPQCPHKDVVVQA